MLSILIPVYNYNLTSLVNDLHCELTNMSINFEIIIGDDASNQLFNNEGLEKLTGVQYYRSENNLGRAKIRNLLASKAQYTYLLFIDCDAGVASNQFIYIYLEKIKEIKETCFVISGGVGYRKESPKQEQYLRWFYGKQREQIDAIIRNQHPYRSFTPFNVLMTKNVFEKVKFDETFSTYGHEDTLFGIALAHNNIMIHHIDNFLYHNGLDNNEIYLQKIESSIENLLKLPWNETMIKDNKLIKTYSWVKKYYLRPTIAFIFKKTKKRIATKLCNSPTLFLLDLYKLGLIACKLK